MFHENSRKSYQLEKYSSAVTLGDMEIFVFPDLLFSLVLANIMSPVVWSWKEDPFFRKIHKMSPYRRIQRLKQFIMDRYEFNLDLDTWGLTTKDRELARFQDFIDTDILSQSNALFGYEGDKYYFDLDIRKHFGLDKYTDNAIPYWKTETVEAMDGFKHKEGYSQGAGECVSLSTLYAAALFVIAKIPLEDIYLLATPLHSQNFVRVREGLVTNNRRIVTKNMWFNGTEITWKAQRALRNEKVTIVANNTGYIHTMYPDATIDPESYRVGKEAMREYLRTTVNMEILANFLRQYSQIQRCFQIRQDYHGQPRYLPAEKAYAYEHGSPFRISDDTRDKLLTDIDSFEFYTEPIEGRMVLNHFEEFFNDHPNLDLSVKADRQKLTDRFCCANQKAGEVGDLLRDFCTIEPRFPEVQNLVPSAAIELDPEWDREQIVEHIHSLREEHPVADLAFYAYRDLSRTDWAPFIKACVERNPVVVDGVKGLSDNEVADRLAELPDESIYPEHRMAQPDEVWNYQRGDGAERALSLAVILKNRKPAREIVVDIQADQAVVRWDEETRSFPSNKNLYQTIRL